MLTLMILLLNFFSLVRGMLVSQSTSLVNTKILQQLLGLVQTFMFSSGWHVDNFDNPLTFHLNCTLFSVFVTNVSMLID